REMRNAVSDFGSVGLVRQNPPEPSLANGGSAGHRGGGRGRYKEHEEEEEEEEEEEDERHRRRGRCFSRRLKSEDLAPRRPCPRARAAAPWTWAAAASWSEAGTAGARRWRRRLGGIRRARTRASLGCSYSAARSPAAPARSGSAPPRTLLAPGEPPVREAVERVLESGGVQQADEVDVGVPLVVACGEVPGQKQEIDLIAEPVVPDYRGSHVAPYLGTFCIMRVVGSCRSSSSAGSRGSSRAAACARAGAASRASARSAEAGGGCGTGPGSCSTETSKGARATGSGTWT
ncbi:unnamed protein product, partial [Prorocentrum cordatum]